MRVKQNYYDTLAMLESNGIPPLMTKNQVSKLFNINPRKLNKLIDNGDLKIKCGTISIGAVASLLCD